MTRTLTIKPHTALFCNGAIRSSPEIPNTNWYEISSIDHGYVATEPVLMVSNSIAMINVSRKIPIMVVNNTNKTFKLKRGCSIARVENINDQKVFSVTAVNKNIDERM